jgi:hypothetical protein
LYLLQYAGTGVMIEIKWRFVDIILFAYSHLQKEEQKTAAIRKEINAC